MWAKLREQRAEAVSYEVQATNWEALGERLAGFWMCGPCGRENWREFKDCGRCGRPRGDGRERGVDGSADARATAPYLVDGLPPRGIEPRTRPRPPGRYLAKRLATERLAAGRQPFAMGALDYDPKSFGAGAKAEAAGAKVSRCMRCRFGGAEAADEGLPNCAHTCRQLLVHTHDDWMPGFMAQRQGLGQLAQHEGCGGGGGGGGGGCGCDKCAPHKHESRADALENLRRSLRRAQPMAMAPGRQRQQQHGGGGPRRRAVAAQQQAGDVNKTPLAQTAAARFVGHAVEAARLRATLACGERLAFEDAEQAVEAKPAAGTALFTAEGTPEDLMRRRLGKDKKWSYFGAKTKVYSRYGSTT